MSATDRSGPLDGIGADILRRRLEAIAREASATVANLARSRAIKEGREASVAILDRTGEVVSTDDPFQMVPAAAATAAVLERFAFDLADGDAVLVSDPYLAGPRLHDFTVLVPFVVDDVVRGHLCARACMPDMGGELPGSYAPDARELWAEGVPIPPVKIHRQGRPRRDVLTSVCLNSRLGDDVRHDLTAMLAGLALGRRRLDEVVADHGIDAVARAMARTLDYGERQARSRIEEWADGTAVATRSLADEDARGGAVSVQAAVTVSGGSVAVELGGCSAQTASFVNATLTTSTAAAATALVALLGPGVPANGGVLRTLTVTSDVGRLTSARFPAAVNGGAIHVAPAVVEATGEALRRLGSQTHGGLAAPRLLVNGHRAGRPVAALDIAAWSVSGCAAARGRDGWGAPHIFSRAVRPTVEEWEAATGARMIRVELVADTAGPGTWRGAPAVEVVFEVDGATGWTISEVGCARPAAGAAGGGQGTASRVRLEHAASACAGSPRRDGAALARRPVTMTARFGGGAGYGDPMGRAVDAVRDDVLDGLLTPEAARRDYGVDVNRTSGEIDRERTGAIRAAGREAGR